MSGADRDATVKRYSERFRRLGYSPNTLGWDKGKQDIRFSVLASPFDLRGKTVLDVGCGFGDLFGYLRGKVGGGFGYVGVDLVEDLVAEGRRRYGPQGAQFVVGDFLDVELDGGFDLVVASGVFNHKPLSGDNYALIEACLAKAFRLCRDGLSFDFLSDRVDYRLEHTFHSSPERILGIAYRLSRNVVLRNDYMPFEFAITVFRDASFASEDTVFRRYQRLMAGRKECAL